MRILRTTSLFAGLALAACGGPTASAAPDFVVVPEALARELADSREAALEKYAGKLLELSGTISEKIRPGGLNDTRGIQFTGIDDRLALDADLSFVSFDPAHAADFDALSVGDAVTVRCVLEVLNESGTLFLVKSCRVVA